MGSGGSLPLWPPENLNTYKKPVVKKTDLEKAMKLDLTSSLKNKAQASRSISTSQLRTLLRFHTWPINVLVSDGPLGGTSPRET